MVTTKKIQLIPVGDPEEKKRVYEYLHDGIYNQCCILNTYMSQVATIYYKYNKDFKNADFKNEYNAIFRNTNTAIKDFQQAKGLGMAGNCGMRVKQDFSTALKNGLARGERSIPYYKRDFPLLCPSRFLTFYTGEDSFLNDKDEEVSVDAFFIKFVNGIHFKCVLGSKNKRRADLYLPELLSSIVEDPEHYHVCGSSIQFHGTKIILNLAVKIEKDAETYNPVEGRTMGLAMGYNKCLVAALSDSDRQYNIGDSNNPEYDLSRQIVTKRVEIQEHRTSLQKSLKGAAGGHGRSKKLKALDTQKKHENNVIRHFNHLMSKSVVDFAKKNKVEVIIMESIEKKDLDDVFLRNWSYYQLQSYITYKAEREGIRVIMSNATSASDKKKKGKKKDTTEETVMKTIHNTCCMCGKEIKREDILPEKIVWANAVSFTCPHCGNHLDYSFNKAKNMTTMG